MNETISITQNRLQTANIAASQAMVVLESICERVELTETQQKRAETAYGAVGAYLGSASSSLSEYSPMVHSQGSMRIGTTKKPRGQEEFDLDAVCGLRSVQNKNADEIYHLVLGQLKASERYREKLVPLDRCIRINYVGDFHLDVIPAVFDSRYTNGRTLISDRKRNKWLVNHPIGFADWFNEIAATLPIFTADGLTTLSNREKMASVEALPEFDRLRKEPLRRIVQILKVSRDECFGDSNWSPSSIVITTLAALSYKMCVRESVFDSPVELIAMVISNLTKFIKATESSVIPFCLWNPVLIEEENLVDHWSIANYREFHKWQSNAVTFIRSMGQENRSGIDSVSQSLSRFAGEEATRQAISTLSEVQASRSRTRKAGFDATGLVTAAAISPAVKSYRPHTNFGK